VRKVKETWKGENIVEIEEKIYLGSVEIKRIRQLDKSSSEITKKLERISLHVMDDKERIALVHHWSKDDSLRELNDNSELNENKIRYQYGNHLGSASLELDGTGNLISYEEHFPYGGTSFITGKNQAEVKLKEYRYTGKERDDSTGLYYYGARYYAPWMGRWMSADPKGVKGSGLNMYWFTSGNPINRVDPKGLSDEKKELDKIVDNVKKMEKSKPSPMTHVETHGYTQKKFESCLDKGTTILLLSSSPIPFLLRQEVPYELK